MSNCADFIYKNGPRPSADQLQTFIQTAQPDLRDDARAIGALQQRLAAAGTHAVLVIFQALDAAGKDGTIRRVFRCCDPSAFDVTAFKAPSKLETRHDFIWRCAREFPPRGHLRVFNRSHYEEVLVVRVHPHYLRAQAIDPARVDAAFWQQRYAAINAVEKHLTQNGTRLIKIMLDVSRAEQYQRFHSRYTEAKKQWKFNPGDLRESLHWDAYQQAFDAMLQHTSTEHAPWHVVPADNKNHMRALVARIVLHKLQELGPQYPAMPVPDSDDAQLISEFFSADKNRDND